MSSTFIEINVPGFTQNLQIIRNQISQVNPKALFCLPVKANAYGHGLVKTSQIAQPYVDYLAVANLDEGIILRQNGITKPILVFGAFFDDELPDLIKYNLEITIPSMYKATLVANYCKTHKCRALVHLKIDTGMNRIGVRVESAPTLIDYVTNCNELVLVGAYSHLVASDNPQNPITNQQIKRFSFVVDYVKKHNPNAICHLANSGALCFFPNAYFDMVRPGILSYGYLPDIEDKHEYAYPDLLNIKPCFSLKSYVTYFKVVEANSGISYNHRYHTTQRTRIVTIPIGYGDGYRRALSNIGYVLIRGNRYPICGTICMDMLMVDIGHDGTAYVNDEVVLIGQQDDREITLTSIASACHTISYEILCGFSNRIPRRYVG